MPEARRAEVGRTCIHKKGVTVRFGFDAVRTSQLPTDCQKQSNGNASWGVFYTAVLASDGSAVCCREGELYIYTGVGLSALYQHCTLKDDISYLLPTWLSAGTGKLKRKHHFIGWQERTNKMKNKSCATNFATQQPFSLLLLLQEPFLLAERKKMCYLSMAANQSQYTNINSFILGYIY